MPDLTPLYRVMAAGGQSFYGLSILQHEKTIRKLVRKTSAKTILDYGCGRGDAWNSSNNFPRDIGVKRKDVTLYDPAFKGNARPIPEGRKYDGVLCSDVLEHVPREDVDALIDKLFRHAKLFVWASVCCRPAKKCFPDGTNLHVTIEPYEWWLNKFHGMNACRVRPLDFCLTETP